MNLTTRKLGVLGVVIMLVPLAHFFLLSHLQGSLSLSFSANNCIFPLIGSFLGPWQTILCMLMVLGSKAYFLGLHGTFGIPSFFAALSWSVQESNKRWLDALCNLVLPLACVVLFCVHPVARAAFPYSLYWFIPMALYIFRQFDMFNRSVVSSALSSTFVAHAVGSVMWVYTVPMRAEEWLGLIPLVAIERLTFVVGMVVVYQVSVGVVIHLMRVCQARRIRKVA